MGRWAEIFQLFASEDIDSYEMDLGVAVLPSLGGAHVDNFAGTVLDHHMTVLAQSRTLHGKGRGSASIGTVESVLMLQKDELAALLRVKVVLKLMGGHQRSTNLRVVGHGG